MRVAQTMADLIGQTPIVQLHRLVSPDMAQVFLKLEKYNPSGSVKDRAAYHMLVQAEKAGNLLAGSTVI
ncbi:pyridoxal-phosphate dependent enzyme, partial [Brevibacillus laterosporus]